MLTHQRALEETKARFEALCDRIEIEAPLSALTISEPSQPTLREQHLFFVTDVLTDGAVSVGDGSGRALVAWCQARRAADQVATPEAA